MKFKVGDKVRVKKNLIVGKDYGSFSFVKTMEEHMGKVVTIYGINLQAGAYDIAEDGAEAYWTDEMLEPTVSKTERVQEDPLVTKIEERNNKPVKMISDENLLNDNDPIKPSHYRKGEIDLYESWYRTYPFNEFRAGMQMIAERYMKRDTDNRIQDLDKAIYSLTRLKEYEEKEREKNG